MNRDSLWAKRAVKLIKLVHEAFPDPEKVEHWPECKMLLLDARSICEKIGEFSIETEVAASLLNRNVSTCYEPPKAKLN